MSVTPVVSRINVNKTNLLEELKIVISKEAQELLFLSNNIPENSINLLEKIISCNGKIVTLGIGKSGIVAKKFAATFSSLGFPSIFLHPVEALHGDIGVVKKEDVCILFSKSGFGSELAQVALALKTFENFVSLISCNTSNKHMANVDLEVSLPFKMEACALNLAPTTSSTLMLAFGDALAVVASQLKNFKNSDFARFHPNGSLGKKLLLNVGDIMHSGEQLPLVAPECKFSDLIYTMSSKKLGIAIVVNSSKQLLGIVTDGDLRRACATYESKVFEKLAFEFMTPNPKVTTISVKAKDALEEMEESFITSLVVLNENRVVGLVHIHDILSSGVR